MKISLNKIYKNLLPGNVSLSRIGSNTLSLTKPGDLDVTILLPESFEFEKNALQQLLDFAHYQSPLGSRVKCACATPDFHKGSLVPVGSVVVTPEDLVIPSAIGTDINCGMRLHHTGLSLPEFLSIKKELVQLLKGDLLEGTRDVPTTDLAMQALFTDGLAGFWGEMRKTPGGMFSSINYAQVLSEVEKLHASAFERGALKYAPENLTNRPWMRDPSLATLGGGNHFCEFQMVKEIVDKKAAYLHGLKVGDVVCMLHTGSRDVGFYVGNRWMDRAKAEYPKDLKYPDSKIFGLEGPLAYEYLTAMHTAAHYATVNRALIAEIVRQRILQLRPGAQNNLITDVPHNIVLKEAVGNVHRKGATPAHKDDLLVIPGSMGHDSYLLAGLGCEKWINSASHGAGRAVSRQEMTFKAKKELNEMRLDSIECITLKEERKIEEAPSAYKEIGPVIASQVQEKVVAPVAVFSPLLTFKA